MALTEGKGGKEGRDLQDGEGGGPGEEGMGGSMMEG